MIGRIYAIPTMYRGVQFRSRLEARYAAFFDLVAWPWRYEPIDLDGYIPDFVIEFDAAPLLVEIKPESSRAAESKIAASGWDGEAAVFVSMWGDESGPHPSPGSFGERVTDVPGETMAWSPARVSRCLSCGLLTVIPEDYSWHCRACVARGGNSHIGYADGALDAWLAAANRVQWRAA